MLWLVQLGWRAASNDIAFGKLLATLGEPRAGNEIDLRALQSRFAE
jgi:hypothetical protein